MTITMLSGKQSYMRLQLGGQVLEGHHYGGAHTRASPAVEALGRWRSGHCCSAATNAHKEQARRPKYTIKNQS